MLPLATTSVSRPNIVGTNVTARSSATRSAAPNIAAPAVRLRLRTMVPPFIGRLLWVGPRAGPTQREAYGLFAVCSASKVNVAVGDRPCRETAPRHACDARRE